MMANECRVSLGDDENILNLILVVDVQHNSVNILKYMELYTLNG